MLHTLKYREEVLAQIRQALRVEPSPEIFEETVSRPLTEINKEPIEILNPHNKFGLVELPKLRVFRVFYSHTLKQCIESFKYHSLLL